MTATSPASAAPNPTSYATHAGAFACSSKRTRSYVASRVPESGESAGKGLFPRKREVPPANRLLRQYLAKNADLRSFTQTDLDTIATRINERPRKVLDWASSHDAFTDSLNTINGALTG